MEFENVNTSEKCVTTKWIHFYLPKRYVVVFLGFIGVTNIFAMRASFTMAIVAMVNQTVLIPVNSSFNQLRECPSLPHEQEPITVSNYKGAILPAMNCVISTWSAKIERSRVSTLIHSGAEVGKVSGMFISAFLCSTDFLGGWPSVFYVYGAVSCMWVLVWWLLMYESPSIHPSISKEELLFIQQNKEEGPKKEKTALFWRKIFTSLPMWAVVISHFGNNFGSIILHLQLPTYLSTALHFNMQSNGIFSIIPFISKIVAGWMLSFVADGLRKNNKLKISTIRKIFNSIGLFGPAICLIGVTQAGCRPGIIIALLSLAMAFNGGVYSGFNVSHIDMCPDFSGTLYAVSNTFANIAGILGPLCVGIFTVDGATLENWSKVFYTAAAVYVLSGAVFIIFGSAELQTWGVMSGRSKAQEAKE